MINAQETIKRLLWSNIENNQISHAYVLEGASGIGKRTLGREFAMALHCKGEKKPCKECSACRQHMAKSHPDFIEILPAEGKNEIAISEVRNMVSDVYIKPIGSNRKIYFFSEPDSLTVARQNAMLKVFEEPPAYASIIISTNHAQNLLETIKSRAIVLKFNPWQKEQMIKLIENLGGREDAEFIADFSGGIAGKAIGLLEDAEFLRLRQEIFSQMPEFIDSKLGIYRMSDFFMANKANIDVLFDIYISILRDIIAAKTSARVVNVDFEEAIENMAQNVSTREVIKAIDTAVFEKKNKAKYANDSLWVTNLFINCWEALND